MSENEDKNLLRSLIPFAAYAHGAHSAISYLLSHCRILFLCKKMKEYTILDKIIIDRPILFLCGPYYNKKDPGDRRSILKNKINELYDKKFLPLIIDDFLTEDNIKDDKISIQLMEEICAAISLQTYIFLDTLSASAELGIFTNSSFMNELKIFIPKENDIYNKKNVGYFVKEVALKSRIERTRVYEYRPRVRRNALATDYIVEFYSFVDDIIPNNIMNVLESDPLLHEKDIHRISVVKKNERPQTPFDVCFTVEGRNIIIHTSIKLLFYTTLSIVFCEYTDFFKKKTGDVDSIDVDKIKEEVFKAYLNLIKRNSYINVDEIEDVKLRTVLKKEYDEILIYHIIKFLHVFNEFSEYNREILFKDPKGKIINQFIIGKYISEVIPLSEKQYEFIDMIKNNPKKYYEKIVIRKGKKEREIVKYKEDEHGIEAKKLHKYILHCLERQYSFSEYSYAYQKGKSIKQCVEKHINGKGFIKYDIKSFFNTITIVQAAERIIKEFEIDPLYKDQVMHVLSGCFWENELPLGFVVSPIISDICLKEFDNAFVKEFENCNISYTRYADDILISFESEITEEIKQKIHNWVSFELGKLGFAINEKKMQSFNFDDRHSFIKYLGINIIKGKECNTISIGRNYIYNVAKEYILYDQDVKENRIDDSTLFYNRLRLIGKIAFINQIEGEEGLLRLKKRLYSYDKDIDINAI